MQWSWRQDVQPANKAGFEALYQSKQWYGGEAVMRVSELISYLSSHCQPSDVVFVNEKPAMLVLDGRGYVVITDYRIERRAPDTVVLNGAEYELDWEPLRTR
jgi:hypothetical protein